MSGSLTRPDPMALIADLARRLGILERRTQPASPTTTAGHSHDGGGENAVILSGDTQYGVPDASGQAAVAAGDSAYAPGDYSVAVGSHSIAEGERGVAVGESARADGSDSTTLGTNAQAAGDSTVAVGHSATAPGEDSVAVGHAAQAGTYGTESSAFGHHAQSVWSHSTAIGADAQTLAANQIVLGTPDDRTVQSAPDSEISDADIIQNQMSFYLDEATNVLVVKVMYSTGAIKTGTLALV